MIFSSSFPLKLLHRRRQELKWHGDDPPRSAEEPPIHFLSIPDGITSFLPFLRKKAGQFFSSYLCLRLGDEVPSNLDPGPEEGLGEVVDVDPEEVGDLLRDGVVRQDGLVRVALLAELHVSKEEHAGDDLPDGLEVLLGDAHDAHGLVGGGELLRLVHGGDVDHAVAEEGVVLGILKDVLPCGGEEEIM